MKDKPKVVDLKKVKYAKTVMRFYDKLERAADREIRQAKGQVERDARKRF